MTRHRPRREPVPAPLRGTLAALVLAGVCSAHAQDLRLPGTMPVPGGAPMAPEAAVDATLGVGSVPTIGPLTGPAGSPSVVGGTTPDAAPPTPRNFYVSGEVTVRGTATDRGRLDRESGSDLILGVSPRLSVHSRGARFRMDATVGVDSIDYTKNTNDDYTQPVAAVDLTAELVERLLFLDAAASVDRRASTPYSTQTADVASEEQVNTGIYRLSPRLERRGLSGWNTLLRSDNIWTHRSGDSVGAGLQPSDEYSNITRFSVDRTPEPFGVGLEGSHEQLSYDSVDVMRIDGARATAGYAFTPQFTAWALAGVERSDFQNRTETDTDHGVRVRWALRERSVLTAEVRRRFFGTGFNAQWDHRHRNFGLTLGGAREPYTAPEAVQLAGDIGQQFDAIFRERGYSPAQREALVRATLNAYGLPASLTDPVSLHVSRPQLNTTGTALVSLLGRRSVFVASVYYRELTDLRRDDDPVLAQLGGNVRQLGGQLSATFRVTPLSSLEASYRYDESTGLGGDAARSSRDQVYTLGTTHALSPRTRVDVSLQHHRLETVDVASPQSSGSSNSLGVGLNYRF